MSGSSGQQLSLGTYGKCPEGCMEEKSIPSVSPTVKFKFKQGK